MSDQLQTQIDDELAQAAAHLRNAIGIAEANGLEFKWEPELQVSTGYYRDDEGYYGHVTGMVEDGFYHWREKNETLHNPHPWPDYLEGEGWAERQKRIVDDPYTVYENDLWDQYVNEFDDSKIADKQIRIGFGFEYHPGARGLEMTNYWTPSSMNC